MFKSILCPVDFSKRSRDASRFAVAMARRFHSEIVALHVAPDGNPAHIAEVEQKLGNFVAHEFGDCLVLPCVVTGDPVERIVQFTHDRRIELVAMATRASRLRATHLGSVASGVLREATCPVWTSAHAIAGPDADFAEPKRILCGLDFGPRSCAALHWASFLAKEFGAALTLAHVIGPEEREHRREAPERTLQRQCERMSCPCDIRILEGSPASELSRLAAEMETGLVVIGRTHASSPGLGANAYGIIAESSCPVLSA